MDVSGDVERDSCWQMVERPFVLSPLQDTLLARCSFSQQWDRESFQRNGCVGNPYCESEVSEVGCLVIAAVSDDFGTGRRQSLDHSPHKNKQSKHRINTHLLYSPF